VATKLENLAPLLRDVLSFTDEKPAKTGDKEKEAELRILVHTSHAGGIIGKGGQRIKELRDETKASIKVFSQCCPDSTERVIAIQGTVDVVIHAVVTILEVIVSNPIKGAVKLYDPINATTFIALEYGGFADASLAIFPPIPGMRPGPLPSQVVRGPTGSVSRKSFDRGTGGGGSWPRGSRSPFVRDTAPYSTRLTWPSIEGMRARTSSDVSQYWSDALELPYPWPSAHHGIVLPSSSPDLLMNADGSASASLTVPHSVSPSKFL